MTGIWTTVSESEFSWEQEALNYVRENLPPNAAMHAWSNFEFVAQSGAIYEVDLLIVGRWGMFLVEIKSRPGQISNNGGSWVWKEGGKHYTDDNPLPLANKKCKELKSLLQRQKAFGKERVPFLEPLIFCSHESNVINLRDEQAFRICVRDRDDGGAPGIIAALSRRECPGLREFTSPPISKPQLRATVAALGQLSMRPSSSARRVGDYKLEQLIHDCPTGSYQDWKGKHATIDSGPRLIRIYQEGLQSESDRAVLRRAAEREYRILERLEHPGLLRVDTLSPTDRGPALVFRWYDDAQRLDHYLAAQEGELPLHITLGILRQIADALAYAHRRKVVHRALSPHSILLRPASKGDIPEVKVFNWQLGLIDGTTTQGSATRMSKSLHAGQLVEDESIVYLAPEAVAGRMLEGEEIDSFSLGAIAYRLFSGQPPAESLLDLTEKLRGNGHHLNLHSVMNGVIQPLAELVQFTANAQRDLRYTAREILEKLDEIEDVMTAPDLGELIDPRIAGPKAKLMHGFTVLHDLGSGSCSKVLLVENSEGQQQVLKVAAKDDYNSRIGEEYEALQKIDHPHVIKAFECFDFGGVTGFTMEPAGEQTLAKRIHDDGPVEIELLERFGEELLIALDHLESIGLGHRDIKPENLGVRSIQKKPLELVLFDFSLVGSPAEKIQIGTPPYLDPFLSERKVQRWDYHAERFAAAMTLHEMATGMLPTWGDEGSHPLYTNAEVTIRMELFPEALREGMAAFFYRSLSRATSERFDNTPEMLRAWKKIFANSGKVKVKGAESNDIDGDSKEARREVLESATLTTPLVLLGLSTRLENVLQRLALNTIEDFLRYPLGSIRKQRGVGAKTRGDADRLYRELREFFPDVGREDRAEMVKTAAEVDVDEELPPEAVSVDLIAKQLIVSAGGKRGSTERSVLETYLGWSTEADDPCALAWRSQSQLGEEAEVTRARVGQIVVAARKRWLRNPSIIRLREDIEAKLLESGGVMTHKELIRLVLITRGSALPDPQCLQMASIATRSAVEAERQVKEPRFSDYRRGDHIFIALDPVFVDFAQNLARAGEELAKSDPLAIPARVLETLGAVESPEVELENLRPADPARRVNLAAAGATSVAVNSRLELYPVGMEARRALQFSQSALFGIKELTAEELTTRVHGRYPRAEPLPERPALDQLLEELGFPLSWVPSARSGQGAYRSRHALTGSGTTSFSSFTRYRTRDVATPTGSITEEIAEAQRIEDKLLWARDEGSFLVLTVEPRLMAAAERELGRFDVETINANRLFIDALRIQADALTVRWDKVLTADAQKRGSEDWTRLQALVKKAMPDVLKRLRQSDKNILLTDLGLFARYKQMHEIDALRNDTGTRTGPHGLWLLLPGKGAALAPSLCDEAVPITNPAQFESLTSEWVLNKHRGEVA